MRIIVNSGPLPSNMPIVSINLSPAAYQIYTEWRRYRRGSAKVSSAVLNYRLRTEELPMLEPGDRRTRDDGTVLEYTDHGFEVVE